MPASFLWERRRCYDPANRFANDIGDVQAGVSQHARGTAKRQTRCRSIFNEAVFIRVIVMANCCFFTSFGIS